jgi:hypothetical protein
MALLFNNYRLEPALKNVPDPPMPPIGGLGIDAVQLAHPFRKVAVGRFDEEMVMVVHEAIGMAKPIVPRNNLSHDAEEVLPISIVNKDVCPGVTA